MINEWGRLRRQRKIRIVEEGTSMFLSLDVY